MATLRASVEGLTLVDKARLRRGWTKTSTASWWQEAHTSRATLRRFWQGDRIQQEIFIAICQVVGVEQWQLVATTESESDTPSKPLAHTDWNQAPDVEVFLGRGQELSLLETCVLTERAKLVAIVGMGGIGKTTLAIALAERVQAEFDWVIWRSLQTRPLLLKLLNDLLFTLNGSDVQSVNQGINELRTYLAQHRCLIVLDGLESVLQEQEYCEQYNFFLTKIADSRHQSCLLVTSQEESQELEFLVDTQRAELLMLKGLLSNDAVALMKESGLYAEEHHLEALAHLYGGNPLALKLTISLIQSMFSGDVFRFLNQNTLFVGDRLQNILKKQIKQLSQLEQTVLYWLAIWREPVSLQRLQTHLFSISDSATLIKALSALERRSLLEKYLDTSEPTFTLQPMVTRIINDDLIKELTEEIKYAFPSHKLNQFAREGFEVLRSRWIQNPTIKHQSVNSIFNIFENQSWNAPVITTHSFQGKHSVIQTELLATINAALKPRCIARAFSKLCCTFGQRSSDPDISIFTWRRIPCDPDGQVANSFPVAPDWAIEIISGDRSQTRVIQSILHGLEHGTEMGWVIDLNEQIIFTYASNQQPQVFDQPQQLLPVPTFASDLYLRPEFIFGHC